MLGSERRGACPGAAAKHPREWPTSLQRAPGALRVVPLPGRLRRDWMCLGLQKLLREFPRSLAAKFRSCFVSLDPRELRWPVHVARVKRGVRVRVQAADPLVPLLETDAACVRRSVVCRTPVAGRRQRCPSEEGAQPSRHAGAFRQPVACVCVHVLKKKYKRHTALHEVRCLY